MEAPVTRREMKEMFELFGSALLARIDEILAERLAKVDERFTKVDERFTKVDEQLAEQRALILTVESSLITRMDGMYDAFRGVPERVSAVEDEELPARVSKLEAVVFAPKCRASSRPRTRRTR
jgi:hypothetical protein